MKTCIKCGETKPKSEFYKDKNRKDGFQYRCKSCQNKMKKEWCEKNKEYVKHTSKTYYEKNQKYYKNYRLQSKFGLTLEQYNEMYNKQNGCCAICGIHQDAFTKALAVDHCHNTGKIRKLLCSNCNSAIGKLKEDIEIFKKAISYLKEHND